MRCLYPWPAGAGRGFRVRWAVALRCWLPVLPWLVVIASQPALAQCAATSSTGYTVNVTIQPISLVPSSMSCQYGYNYNIKFNYQVSFTGSNIPSSLYTLQTTFTCANAGNSSHFAQLPTTPGSGTLTTGSNPYRTTADCTTASVASLGCNNISVYLQGPGLNTTINCPYAGKPLPVTLTSFAAQRTGGYIALSWSTASEQDNARTAVEQSSDGRTWQAIAWLSGAFTSQQAHTYHATAMAESTTMYYRLRFVATDGRNSFSPVVVVAPAPVTLALVPNPNVSQRLKVLGLDSQLPTELQLYDLRGRLHFQTTVSEAEVNLPALPAGLYVARLSTAAGASTTMRYVQQ